uniref:Uncharacterized protein n=1 Tax=Glossina austeni TaxID=7395 RepID=A0A1A9UD80_GLOAU
MGKCAKALQLISLKFGRVIDISAHYRMELSFYLIHDPCRNGGIFQRRLPNNSLHETNCDGNKDDISNLSAKLQNHVFNLYVKVNPFNYAHEFRAFERISIESTQEITFSSSKLEVNHSSDVHEVRVQPLKMQSKSLATVFYDVMTPVTIFPNQVILFKTQLRSQVVFM